MKRVLFLILIVFELVSYGQQFDLLQTNYYTYTSIDTTTFDSLKINFSGINISETGWYDVNGASNFPGTAAVDGTVTITSSQTYTYGVNGYYPNVYPDSVSMSLAYKSDSIVLTINNLASNTYYSYDILCSRATSGTKYSKITLNDTFQVIQTVNNTTLVHFDSILSSGTGTQHVSIISTSSTGGVFENSGNYLNAFVITNTPAPEQAVDDTSFVMSLKTIVNADSSITLPLVSGYTYDFTVNWGDGDTSIITSYDDVDATHQYSSLDTVSVKITGTCQYLRFYDFSTDDKAKVLEITELGDVGFTSLRQSFRGLNNLKSVSGTYDLDSVINATKSFYDDTALTYCKLYLSNATKIDSSWFNCSKMSDIDFYFPEVLTAIRSWYNCAKIDSFKTDLPKVTNVSYAWGSNISLKSFTSLLPEATNASGAWLYDILLDSFKTDLPKTTRVDNAWNTCTGLVYFSSSLPKVTNLNYAWDGDAALVKFISPLNDSIHTMYSSWHNCTLLDSVPALETIDISLLTSATSCLQGVSLVSANVDSIYKNFTESATVPTDIIIHLGSSKYTSYGETYRNILTDTYSWVITDGGLE